MSHDIQTLERRGMSKLQLMPHQRQAVSFGLKHGKMLLGADPGTGKTAVAAILATNWLWTGATKVLVVCPATLKLNWLREIEQWNEVSATRIPDLSIGIASGSYFPDDCHIVIINYDILHRHKQQIEETQWDLAILDESHAIRNRNSLRSKMVVGGVSMEKIKERGKPTKQKIKERFTGIKARYKLALSGTPILNKPIEIWTTLKWLDSEKWGNYKWFTERYCGAAPTGWGGSMDVSGCTNAKELHHRLQNLMFRVLKKDVLKDLPPKIQQIIPLPAPQSVKVTLDKQLKEWGLHEPTLKELRRRREEAKLAHNQEEFERLGLQLRQAQSAGLAAMSTYRKELGISKIPLVVQHVEDALENGTKIIVFAHHLEVITTIASNLMKYNPVVIHGGTPNDKRQAAVDKFQADPSVRVAVLSILAAGVGITLTASSHVVFAECDWRPGINSQALDRCIAHNQVVFCQRAANNHGMSIAKIQDIEVGDKVLTHLGNWKVVTGKKRSTWTDGRMTEIDYIGAEEPLKCTFDHHVLCVKKEGHGPFWIKAHEVAPCDYLVMPRPSECQELLQIPFKEKWRWRRAPLSHCCMDGCTERIEARSMCRSHYRQWLQMPSNERPETQANNVSKYKRLPINDIEMSDDMIFMLGWYLAEGFSSINKNKGKFVSLSGHKEETNILSQIAKRVFEPLGVSWNIYPDKRTNGVEMRAFSADMALWLTDWFGVGQENRSIPPELMNLSRRQTAILLKAYIQGDGYSRDGRSVEWVSCSRILSYQMCILAAKCGYAPTLRKIKDKDHWVGGFSNGSKTNEEFILRKVRWVHSFYEKRPYVYDIAVDDDHSFMVGFASVHNCHRHGQKESVLGQYLVYEDSLDAVILRRCIEKQQMIDTVVDGRKEVTRIPEAGKEVATPPRPSPEKLELLRMALKQVQDVGEASTAHVTEIRRFLELEKLKPQHETRALELALMYRGCLSPSLRMVLR